jgi:hypothetical protein
MAGPCALCRVLAADRLIAAARLFPGACQSLFSKCSAGSSQLAGKGSLKRLAQSLVAAKKTEHSAAAVCAGAIVKHERS